MATLTTVINAFQTKNATITGIKTAPQLDEYPAELTPDKLPCAITMPGPGTWPHGDGGIGSRRKSLRTYVVRVYIAPASAPDVGAAFTSIGLLMEAVGTAYRALRTIGTATLQFGPNAGLEDRGALRTIPYGGEQFYGFELMVPVTEI